MQQDPPARTIHVVLLFSADEDKIQHLIRLVPLSMDRVTFILALARVCHSIPPRF